MTDHHPARGTASTPPPRRTRRRSLGAVAVLAFGMFVLYGGVDAMGWDPAEYIAPAGRGRAPATEESAVSGGVIMCLFGLAVLGYGVALLRKPGSKDGKSSGNSS